MNSLTPDLRVRTMVSCGLPEFVSGSAHLQSGISSLSVRHGPESFANMLLVSSVPASTKKRVSAGLRGGNSRWYSKTELATANASAHAEL